MPGTASVNAVYVAFFFYSLLLLLLHATNDSLVDGDDDGDRMCKCHKEVSSLEMPPKRQPELPT